MILYTADLHFGHRNIIGMDHRPFLDTDEMDAYMIYLWNDRVSEDDDVYILGDFCYKAFHSADWYLRQLKGRKYFIFGNHDKAVINNPTALSYFKKTADLMTINDNGKQVVLCHYPLAEWPGYFRGAYHVYGHIHNNLNKAYEVMKSEDKALNAGCMINRYTPVSLRELIENNLLFKKNH